MPDKLLILPGDGIGPEVMTEVRKVIDWFAAEKGLAFEVEEDLVGGAAYDDRLTRLKLKQAYGRLVRRADDTGVFVMLDSRTPTRLLGAFPDGVEVHRIGLAEAVAETRAFLGG